MKQERCYLNHREVWDVAKCEKMAKRVARDGMGTPYPFKGAVPGPFPCDFGKTLYNGGCVRPMTGPNQKWYPGEIWPLPKLAPGFKWVRAVTWSWRIVKKSADKA